MAIGKPSDHHCCLFALIQNRLGRSLRLIGADILDGPEQCSGLPVAGYALDMLHGEFCPTFELVGTCRRGLRDLTPVLSYVGQTQAVG